MRKQCNLVRWSIVLLTILLLSGCGFSPSDSEVERALTQGDPLIGKVYLIRNIRRINGYERPEGYVIEYGADVQMLTDPVKYFGSLSKADQSGIGALVALGQATDGLARWGLLTAAAISAAKKGDVIPFSGTLTMIKSERGWILRPD